MNEKNVARIFSQSHELFNFIDKYIKQTGFIFPFINYCLRIELRLVEMNIQLLERTKI